MRSICILSALACLLLFSESTKAATTYYSQGGSDPGLLGNWNSNRGGGGAAPANFNSGDTFVIQNSHLMNTIGAWTVSGAGGIIQIELGGTLVANNIVAVPTFQVDNGGTYIHNAVSGSANGSASDVPGASSRTFATNSTEEFQKWANGGSSPTALPSPVTWGNLKINVASLAGSWNQVGSLNSVAGGLTIQQTGGGAREFRLVANSVSGTTTVGANLRVEGGLLTFSSGTATATVNVAGSLTVAGGALQEATSTGSGPLNVTNAIFVGGGVLSIGPNPFPSSPASFTIDGGALKASASGVIPAGRVISIGANGGELGTVSSAAGTLTLSNNFVGAAGLTIHAGTVVLAGTNSFTGNLTIAGVSSTNNPTVRFHSDFAAGMGQIVVSPTDPGVTTILGRSISGTTTVTNDMVVNSGGFLTLLSALSSSSITFSGKISGGATLSRANFIEATVTLLGDNSGWSGGLVLQEGITRLGHKNALGTGPLSIIPGSDGVYLQAALPLSGINAVTNSVNIVNSNANTLGLYGTNDFEMAGPIALSGRTAMLDCSGSGARILSGAISGDPGVGLAKFNSSSGTLTLTAANTYTGPTTISAGKLVVNGSLASTNVTVNSPGMLGGIGAIGGPVTVNNAGSISPGSSAGILTLTNGLNLSSGGTNVWELATNTTANPGTAFDQIGLSGGTLTLGGSSRLLINFIGSATAPETLTPFWQSPHTWTIISLSGAATNAGNSNFTSIAGTNGITAGTFSTAVSGGSILLTYTPVTNRAPMTLTWSGGGANAFWSNSTNWVGNIAPLNGDALVFPTGAARLVNTNPVGGPTNFAAITLSGSNYVIFSPALTLTNGFTNSPPSLRSNRLEAAIALGGDQTWKLIAAAGTLTLASNVTLGPFHLNLIGLASPTLEVLGNITGSAGSQVFMDGGVLKLSGSANDIPDFQVNSGNLQMNGVLSGGLSIAIGARLLGIGTVPAFTCDGSFQPGGPAAPGAMTISSGSTVFTSGSDFEVDLFGSASPGVNYDQVRVSTPPDLSGATLNVTPFYSATNGETFVIITNTGISPFTTTFPEFPEGKIMVFSSPANEFRISYAGGDGNDVTLKRVPLGTASAPRLTIQTAGANAVRLLWPTNPPLFNLESNTNLASTNWIAVSPAPVVIGTNKIVTNSVIPAPAFYRLKK